MCYIYAVYCPPLSPITHGLLETCQAKMAGYRAILADVTVYIFVHLHRALRTEGKVLTPGS